MSAQLRLTLSDEQARKLDAIRGLATRTRYADYLLAWAIDVGGPAGHADALERAEKEQR